MATHHGMLYPQLRNPLPLTVEAPNCSPVAGETIPRRLRKSADKLATQPGPDVATIYDCLEHATTKYRDAPAIGARKVVKVHKETKTVTKVVAGVEKRVPKEWTFWELSPYEFLSYTEFKKQVLCIGSGLRAISMRKGYKIGLCGATSATWFTMALATCSQSMTMVTAYDSLGVDGLRHSLKQTGAKAIFIDSDLLSTLQKGLEGVETITHVIYNVTTGLDMTILDKIRASYPHLKLLSFEDLRALGEKSPAAPVPPKSSDLACVMYTSGTTGPPKGVMIRHSSIVAAVAGIDIIASPYIGRTDSNLAYLPQAHIFEFAMEMACLFWGVKMGFGSPKTLTDLSVRNCKGDIQEFKPSVLVGVPAVWETVKKGILARLASGPALARILFNLCMILKTFFLSMSFPLIFIDLLDAIVFSRLKAATGGRLRVVVNGGGPISRDTLNFLSIALAPMISGYGLTETCGMGALQDPMSWNPDALGEMPGCIEIKLVDVPQLGYSTTHDPPQGEILIRGAPVMEGYYDDPVQTAEVLTLDGWFKTGDVGEWTSTGQLRLIDRKKNLVKTLNGEYIALEKLESIYRGTAVVRDVCVVARDDQAKPIAVVVPVEPALRKLAATQGEGLQDKSLEDLVHEPKVQAAVLKEMQKLGRDSGLAAIEMIDGVVLVDEEWTPQNGMVTPAMKVQRRKITAKYQADIAKVYGLKLKQ